MAELKGSLGSLGLAAIAQLIGELHHSGNLELTRNASRGALGFDDGRLVAATYNAHLRGVKALAACTRELVDAEFVFVEGPPAGERTLDLGGSELQKVFGRIERGEDIADGLDARSVGPDEPAASESCRFLGFVDDATRHYSRPTALHRCYAAGGPALVSADDQRELCLSGRFPTCPRYRNAATANGVPTPPAAAAPQPAAAAFPGPPASAAPAASPGPPASAPPAPLQPARPPAAARAVPADAAARTQAAEQMRVSTPPPALTSPTLAAPPAHELAVPWTHAATTQPAPRSRTRLRLIGIGGGLGLLILIGAALLFRPTRTGGGTQSPSNVAGPSQPEATRVAGPTSVARPTSVPELAAKPVPASSPLPNSAPTLARATPVAPSAPPAPPRQAPSPAVPTVAVAGVAVAAPVPGQPLVDVRFASGPKPGWVESRPYAAWADGAYRLKAGQAAHFVAIGAPVEGPQTDVVVSATFRKTGGPPGGGYGLVVRNQNADSLDGVNQNVTAYVMEAGDLGEFGIWLREGDHWVDLVPWTRTDGVRPGGSPNDLEVRAVGDQLTFSVNGAELASIQDDTLPSGGVGVFVGGDSNEVALDRFVAQVPD